jgi:hypothetical protein
MKTAIRMIMAVAAASMAILPVAAQANTRAGDSGAVYTTASAQPGLGRAADGEAAAGGLSIILALFSSALIITGIVFATQSDDNGQSPGT